jgi:sec-independent protein translocase protein TatC
MVVLFEMAIQVARLVDRRRARRAAIESFHDIADDEPSPLDPIPWRLDEETPGWRNPVTRKDRAGLT